MATTGAFEFLWDKCRRGTKETLLTGVERFTGGEKEMSVNMPTRMGKTPTGRLFAGVSTRGWQSPGGAFVPRFASVNLWVTINVPLRRQAVSPTHWTETNAIFGIKDSLIFGEIEDGYQSLVTLRNNARPNGEEYLAVNIHKVSQYVDIYQQWIDHLVAADKPPIFHFDEAHLLSDEKVWGKLVPAVIEAGAYAVTWTATPRRADGGLIPNFIPHELGQDHRVIKQYDDEVEIDGKRYGIFKNIDQHTTDYVLRAHVDIPFSEAWSMGYLLKPSFMTIDVEMSELDPESKEDLRNVMLSQLTPATLRQNGIIGRAVRNPKVIREAVALAYEHLMQWRRISPRAALVGFTVADRDGGKNEHAQQVRKEFLRLDPSLKIVIATQKVDGAADLIEKFDESDNDIILFKGMGGAGWDCARIQVELDLGDDRQDAQVIQRWMRPGTPWMNHKAFSLITLADALNKSIFDRCVGDEGGAASVKISELIDTELQELKEKEDRPIWIVSGSGQGDFGDPDGHMAEAKDAPLASALMHLMSHFRASVTDAELVEKAKELRITVNSQSQSKSLDQQIQELRDDINAALGEATRRLYWGIYKEYDSKMWQDTIRYIYRRAYDSAGLSYDTDYVPLDKNRNRDQLMLLDRHAQITLEWSKSYAKADAN